MTLGGADNPFGGLELSSQGSAKPEKSQLPTTEFLAVQDADQQVRLQGEAAHDAALEPDRKRADIQIAVETQWNYCGLEPCNESAELATDILAEYQTALQVDDPSYVVGNAETQTELNDIVARGVSRQERRAGRKLEETDTVAAQTETLSDQSNEEAGEVTETDEVETDNNAHAEWLAKHNGDFVEAVKDAANMPVGEPPNPELVAERAKLMQFQQILTIASSNEVDKAIVTASLAKIDMTKPPSAASFARSFIFDSPDSQIQTGVSEATQAAIAESLGITLPKQEPKTGGDVNDVYNKGGLETYVDENGEKQERRVPLPKDQRVPFTDEAELGYDNQGNKTAWVTTEGGVFNTKLPDNPTDRELGDIIRTVQLRGKLHALNIAHIVYPDVTIEERGGGRITVQPWHYEITDRFLETVVSNRAVAGNNLLSQPDLDKIPYLMQFNDRKGDAGIADVNPDQTVEDYRAQGIIGESGTLNWERFNALVSANRSNLYTEANFKANAADFEDEQNDDAGL